MTANIFISFASQDIRVAMTICQALESRGFKCWISARDILPGDNFQVSIVQAIRHAKIMLLVFTAASNNSQEVTKELALASQEKLIVIPLRVEDVAPNDAFAYEFATRQWIDLFRDWEIAMDQLSQRISNALSDSSRPDILPSHAEQAAIDEAAAVAAAEVKPPPAVETPEPPARKAVTAPQSEAPAAPAAETVAKAVLKTVADAPRTPPKAEAKPAAKPVPPPTPVVAKPVPASPANDAADEAEAAPRRMRPGLLVAAGLVVAVVVAGLTIPSMMKRSGAAEATAAAIAAQPVAPVTAPVVETPAVQTASTEAVATGAPVAELTPVEPATEPAAAPVVRKPRKPKVAKAAPEHAVDIPY